MPSFFSVSKTKKSTLKRLSLLPRIGFVMDFGGRKFVFRQAPILETLINLKKEGFSMKAIMEISRKQFNEISMNDQIKEDHTLTVP